MIQDGQSGTSEFKQLRRLVARCHTPERACIRYHAAAMLSCPMVLRTCWKHACSIQKKFAASSEKQSVSSKGHGSAHSVLWSILVATCIAYRFESTQSAERDAPCPAMHNMESAFGARRFAGALHVWCQFILCVGSVQACFFWASQNLAQPCVQHSFCRAPFGV